MTGAAPDGTTQPDSVRLTARQAELLRHCVQRGYYSIPRRTTLRELGAEIGISATSLSLALRRAEAKIILAFAQTDGKPEVLQEAIVRPVRPRPPALGQAAKPSPRTSP